MKINSHPFIKQDRRRGRYFVPAIVIIFLAIIMFFGVYVQRISYPLAAFIITPFTSFSYVVSVGFDGFFSIFTDKRALIAENEALKKELQEKTIELAAARLIVDEKDALREVFLNEKEQDILIANVISKPNFSPYDTAIIGVGERNGISVGDKIVSGDYVVVGEVVSVYSGTARVKFFSSPGEEHVVSIGGSGIEARATGKGGGNFEVVLPVGVDIAEGDAVTFPEVSGKIFGVVEKIYSAPSDTFQRILFKNPVNINELRFIGVIKSDLK